MSPARRAVAASVVVVAATLAAVTAAAPAQAAGQYRWWGYWFVSPGGGWTYGSIGAGGHRVDDGGVEGWRFAVGTPSPSAPAPRTSAAGAFEAICGGTPRPDGHDRVALVVDFGTAADAPPGEHPPSSSVRGTCVVVPDRSNGLKVLAEAGYSLRQDSSGLVCGIQGYPRSECGVVVKPSSSPRPTPRPTSQPSAHPSSGPSSNPTATPTARSAASPGPKPTGSAGPGPSSSVARPAARSTVAVSPSPAGSATGSAAAALEVGPPPDGPGRSSTSLAGLTAGVLLVAGLATAAILRGRSGRGTP